MKRFTVQRLGKTIVFVLTGIAGMVFVAIIWGTATHQGTRWLLTSAARQGWFSFSADTVEGRIIDHLLLTHVRITVSEQKIELKSLELRWKPLLLLTGTVTIQELVLNGLHIQDDAPLDNRPPLLAWPKTPDIVQLFDGMIAHLRVSDVSYRRRQELPVLITSIDSSVTWQDNLLSATEVRAVSPAGQLSGSFSADFSQPSLTAELALVLAQPIAKMNQFLVTVQPGSRTTEQTFGFVTVVGSSDTRKMLAVSGDVEMADSTLQLKHLRLTSPQQHGLVTAEGSLEFTPTEPILLLQVTATGLSIAPEFNIPTNLSGTARFAGTMNRYRGEVTLANKGTGWQKAALVAAYHGTRDGVTLTPLTARILDGSLTGNLDINWHNGVTLHGAVSGRKLNPARINPHWQGKANFNATGHMAWRDNAPRTGSISGTLLESYLHGQKLSGELQADFSGTTISVSRLSLLGKGFDLHASGAVNRRLAVAVQVSDLSRLIPGSAGMFQGDGWLRWSHQQLSGSVTGTGSALTYAGTQIASASLTARREHGEASPGHIDLYLRNITHDPYLLDAVTIAAYVNFLPEWRFELDGSASLSGGTVLRNRLKLPPASAAATWRWRKNALVGTIAMNMAEHGKADAHFRLPVSARLPLSINRRTSLQATLNGHFQEQGMIATLFPESVRNSFGALDTELAIRGTWGRPTFSGTLQLAEAGAYLPAAGIHLKDVQLKAHLEKNILRIDSFRALSGSGYLDGRAILTLSDWQLTGYQGTVQGKNFQAVYLPELRILCTPELSFAGTPQNFTLRGELRLPELKYDSSTSHTVITTSSDIVREGTIVPTTQKPSLAVDAHIRVLSGERVFVKVAGIDAQLGGAVDLSITSLDDITGRGEVAVVKGHYRTYGVDLEIVRGRLFYTGGSIFQPTLDFLALRSIGDVKAGVTVAGSIRNPAIKLYSEPAMPDADVLSYIILNHPNESSSIQTGLADKVTGALLGSNQAIAVQDQIKNSFGLSTLEIQDGGSTGSSPMGHTPLQVTAPGAIPTELQSGLTDTVLTVGKFLTPQLYISYGQSLFNGSNLFLLRYDIFRQWQIETQTGSESGADLFYKLEFK
jgi:autotransporter translocation and assembly factor TamB